LGVAASAIAAVAGSACLAFQKIAAFAEFAPATADKSQLVLDL
jgi:hypothetical protein